MFSPTTYHARRQRLLADERLDRGLVLLLGNEQTAMNYEDNPYPFRQDSTFLYYLGIDEPGFAAVLDLEEGGTTLYGPTLSLDDIVWMGDRPSLADYGAQADVDETAPRSDLAERMASALESGRPIHFLPPYRDRHHTQLEHLLGIRASAQERYASDSLIQTVIDMRSQKSEDEVEALEQALATTAEMHEHAMRHATPGTSERAIAGAMGGIAEQQGAGYSFRPTCSVHGEVLHNHSYDGTLTPGDLLLVDAGAAAPSHYAGDITRVTPVGGSFSDRQARLYRAVLAAQEAAIEATTPGTPFREVHLHSARVLTEHLIDIGLMQGPADEAVSAGAHALFFPHGLGHMLGLDAHDMENLGEASVGYADDQERSDQFGLSALRLARPLESGFVVTIEPGCYFIPTLIERWREADRHSAYINYDRVADFVGLGGIRIEDDVLVTDEGARVLGPGIPKSVEAVEAIAATAG